MAKNRQGRLKELESFLKSYKIILFGGSEFFKVLKSFGLKESFPRSARLVVTFLFKFISHRIS